MVLRALGARDRSKSWVPLLPAGVRPRCSLPGSAGEVTGGFLGEGSHQKEEMSGPHGRDAFPRKVWASGRKVTGPRRARGSTPPTSVCPSCYALSNMLPLGARPKAVTGSPRTKPLTRIPRTGKWGQWPRPARGLLWELVLLPENVPVAQTGLEQSLIGRLWGDETQASIP